MKIGILGAGAYAIALTKVLEEKGHEIILWTKFEQEKNDIEYSRENTKLFPGIKIHDDVKITNDIKEVIINAQVIINVLPFVAIRDTIDIIKPIYNKDQIILSTTKGIDEEMFTTSTELFENILGATKIAALSGPSFAIEVAKKDNVSLMLGSKDKEVLDVLKELLNVPYINIVETDDIKGIQLAGGIKNAIAIGSGILNGLKAADSTKAAFLTSGMADMAKILVLLGGVKETTYTYAGLGDLILTCMSGISRNYIFGTYLGEGYTIDEAFEKMDQKAVEGYNVVKTLHKYIKENNVKVHTIEKLYNVIFKGENPNVIKKI